MKTIFKTLWKFFKKSVIINISTENYPPVPDGCFTLLREKVKLDKDQFLYFSIYINF